MKSHLLVFIFICSILSIQSQNYHYLTYSLRTMGLASKSQLERNRFEGSQITFTSLRPALAIGAGIGQKQKDSNINIQLDLSLSYHRFFNELTRYFPFRQAGFVDIIRYRRKYSSYHFELKPSFVHQIKQSPLEIRWGFRFGLQIYQYGQLDRIQQRFVLESPGTQPGESLSDEILLQSTFANRTWDTFGWLEMGSKYWFSAKRDRGLEIFASLSPAILGRKGREYSYVFGINLIQRWDRPAKK